MTDKNKYGKVIPLFKRKNAVDESVKRVDLFLSRSEYLSQAINKEARLAKTTVAALCLYAVGVGTGYGIWGKELNEIKETQQTAACTKELEPLWTKFQEGCAKKTLDTLYDGSLDPIVQQRKQIVERLDCPSSIDDKAWKCSYNVSEGRFETIKK